MKPEARALTRESKIKEREIKMMEKSNVSVQKSQKLEDMYPKDS